jgi:homoserine acetyltransferase
VKCTFPRLINKTYAPIAVYNSIMSANDDYQTYKLGNFKLKSGGEIPDAFIAYKTLGDPSLPAVIYPTWYSGSMRS